VAASCQLQPLQSAPQFYKTVVLKRRLDASALLPKQCHSSASQRTSSTAKPACVHCAFGGSIKSAQHNHACLGGCSQEVLCFTKNLGASCSAAPRLLLLPWLEHQFRLSAQVASAAASCPSIRMLRTMLPCCGSPAVAAARARSLLLCRPWPALLADPAPLSLC
jgi:hypothetical protein